MTTELPSAETSNTPTSKFIVITVRSSEKQVPVG
jgi:hypothetical protein